MSAGRTEQTCNESGVPFGVAKRKLVHALAATTASFCAFYVLSFLNELVLKGKPLASAARADTGFLLLASVFLLEMLVVLCLGSSKTIKTFARALRMLGWIILTAFGGFLVYSIPSAKVDGHPAWAIVIGLCLLLLVGGILALPTFWVANQCDEILHGPRRRRHDVQRSRLPVKTWVAILFVLAWLGIFMAGMEQSSGGAAKFWPIMIAALIVPITSALAAYDSRRIHLRRFKSGISYGPVGLFVVSALFWPLSLIWYLIVRLRIHRGTMPLKDVPPPETDFSPHRLVQPWRGRNI